MSRTIQYTVWVGGTEIGTYATEDEAEQVWSDWKDDGYQDVAIEEWLTDEDTPEEQNNRLLSIGY